MRILPILIASLLCLATTATGTLADDDVKVPKQSRHPKTPPPSTVPGTATAMPGTGTTTPAATTTAASAVEGRKAYLKYNCYGCHGMGATGAMGPSIVRADAGDVSEAVLQGEDEGMPSYRRITTAADIRNLTAYLRSIGTAAEPKFNDWWVPVPTK